MEEFVGQQPPRLHLAPADPTPSENPNGLPDAVISLGMMNAVANVALLCLMNDNFYADSSSGPSLLLGMGAGGSTVIFMILRELRRMRLQKSPARSYLGSHHASTAAGIALGISTISFIAHHPYSLDRDGGLGAGLLTAFASISALYAVGISALNEFLPSVLDFIDRLHITPSPRGAIIRDLRKSGMNAEEEQWLLSRVNRGVEAIVAEMKAAACAEALIPDTRVHISSDEPEEKTATQARARLSVRR
jgi:hypothetical protein